MALAKHLEGKVFINGAFQTTAGRFDVNSPATGKLIAGAAKGAEKVSFLSFVRRFFFFFFFSYKGSQRRCRGRKHCI
jgi:hypothetical protein